jgi:hypothetical protein
VARYTLQWDEAELAAEFDDREGVLKGLMTAIGEVVVLGAKRRAERRTGTMQRDIAYAVLEDEAGIYVDIYSPARAPKTGFPYPIVHEGKKIRDRRPHRSLRPALTDIKKILG